LINTGSLSGGHADIEADTDNEYCSTIIGSGRPTKFRQDSADLSTFDNDIIWPLGLRLYGKRSQEVGNAEGDGHGQGAQILDLNSGVQDEGAHQVAPGGGLPSMAAAAAPGGLLMGCKHRARRQRLAALQLLQQRRIG